MVRRRPESQSGYLTGEVRYSRQKVVSQFSPFSELKSEKCISLNMESMFEYSAILFTRPLVKSLTSETVLQRKMSISNCLVGNSKHGK